MFDIRSISPLSLRNFIFGVEDGLVSTVGLLAGVAVAGVDTSTVILTGAVLIFVEAFSMAVGSFLSEQSVEELSAHGKVPVRKPILGGLVMFISYVCAGLVPLGPYLVLSGMYAVWASILLTLAALFVLGSLSGKISRGGILRSGLRMFVVGGIAVAVGAVIGVLFA